MVTGLLPNGVMLNPLTVLGLMPKGNIFLMYWPGNSNNSFPALNMSALESDTTGFNICWICIYCNCWCWFSCYFLTVYNCRCCCWLSCCDWTWIVLALGWHCWLLACRWACPLQHTFTKCPTLLHRAHVRLYTEHQQHPPLWVADPHSGQAVENSDSGMHMVMFFAASLLQHLATTVGKVRLFFCSSYSIVSLSLIPSIIWSKLFCATLWTEFADLCKLS